VDYESLFKDIKSFISQAIAACPATFAGSLQLASLGDS